VNRFLRYQGMKSSRGTREEVFDALAVEHPLKISINDALVTLTMQTPGDEMFLARGILFAEGIYKHRNVHPVFHVEERSDQGYVSAIRAEVDALMIDTSQLNKRNLLSVASCGICGKTELPLLPKASARYRVKEPSSDALQAMYDDMRQMQELFAITGGAHGAGVYSAHAERLSVKEDIGRHNAVDKAVGELLQKEQLAEAGYLLCSGRISYEIVAKCFMAGIPVLCAVSAPSTLAVDFCKELGIVLMAFCREGRFTRYA
jgi:FdhD protein